MAERKWIFEGVVYYIANKRKLNAYPREYTDDERKINKIQSFVIFFFFFFAIKITKITVDLERISYEWAALQCLIDKMRRLTQSPKSSQSVWVTVCLNRKDNGGGGNLYHTIFAAPVRGRASTLFT